MNKFKKAFTIIEILLAVSVIAITSTVAYFIWEGTTRPKVRDAQRITDVNAIKLAVEAYFEKYNKYPPANGQGFDSAEYFYSNGNPAALPNWIPELVPEFIKELPKDPKQTSFNILIKLAELFKQKEKNVIRTAYAATGDVYAYDGVSWSTKASGYPGTNPIDFSWSSVDGYNYLDTTGNIYRMIGGWSTVATGYPGSNPVDFEGTSTFTVLDASGNIYRFSGGSWTTFATGYPGTNPKDLEPDSSNWLVLDASGNIYRFSGGSWTTFATGYPGTTAVELGGEGASAGFKVLDANGNVYRYNYNNCSCWETIASGYPGTTPVAMTDASTQTKVVDANGTIYNFTVGNGYTTFATGYPGSNPKDIDYTTDGWPVLEGITTPTPTPTPTPSPTPTPPPPSYYLYWVSLDRKTFNVWAALENLKDPRIYTMPTAQCRTTPPAGADPAYNYCGAGF